MSLILCHYHSRSRTFILTCHFSSKPSSTKIPLLYKPEQDDQTDTVTPQLLSWGKGASDQLSGGIEEICLYPTPVANFIVSQSSFALPPTPGRHVSPQIHLGKWVFLVGCSTRHCPLMASSGFGEKGTVVASGLAMRIRFLCPLWTPIWVCARVFWVLFSCVLVFDFLGLYLKFLGLYSLGFENFGCSI